MRQLVTKPLLFSNKTFINLVYLYCLSERYMCYCLGELLYMENRKDCLLLLCSYRLDMDRKMSDQIALDMIQPHNQYKCDYFRIDLVDKRYTRLLPLHWNGLRHIAGRKFDLNLADSNLADMTYILKILDLSQKYRVNISDIPLIQAKLNSQFHNQSK